MQVSLEESALLPVRLLKPSFHCATLNKNSWATDTTMEEFFHSHAGSWAQKEQPSKTRHR